MVACHGNHLKVAHYLIQKGASVNFIGKVRILLSLLFADVSFYITSCHTNIYYRQNGWSALLDACDEGHTAVIQLLIESKAKLDIKNNVSVNLHACWVVYRRLV